MKSSWARSFLRNTVRIVVNKGGRRSMVASCEVGEL